MFICTVKASTIRFVGLIVVAAALLTGVLIHAGNETVQAAGYQFGKIRSDADRVAFLEQFGWKSVNAPANTETFTVPDTFDRVMLGYNEIQRAQGLDLSRYENKKVTRYTFEVTNYPDYEGKVYANLIMYRDKVVAADISSADPMGFVQGLERK